MYKAGLCRQAVRCLSVHPSVCLSICPSLCPSRSCILSKRINTSSILPRDAMHKRSYWRHAVSVCLSRSWIMSKRINVSSNFFSPSGSHTILVFPYQTGWRYSNGNPPNGGVECRWGIGRNRDFGQIAGYRRLLDLRSTKTPTTKLSI